jgi:hypothetical protein
MWMLICAGVVCGAWGFCWALVRIGGECQLEFGKGYDEAQFGESSLPAEWHQDHAYRPGERHPSV